MARLIHASQEGIVRLISCHHNVLVDLQLLLHIDSNLAVSMTSHQMSLLFQRRVLDIICTVSHRFSIREYSNLALLLLLTHRFLELSHLSISFNDVGRLFDDVLFISLCAKVLSDPYRLFKSFTAACDRLDFHIS